MKEEMNIWIFIIFPKLLYLFFVWISFNFWCYLINALYLLLFPLLYIPYFYCTAVTLLKDLNILKPIFFGRNKGTWIYSAEGAPHCSFSSISIILIPYREKKGKSKCHISRTSAFTFITILQGLQVMAIYSFQKSRLIVTHYICIIFYSSVSRTLSPHVLRTTHRSRRSLRSQS